MSSFGAFEVAEGSWLGFGIMILIWIWSLVFYATMIKILACFVDLKVQNTAMSFKSSFRALEDAGGSWLGFDIMILICICFIFFDEAMIWILALYLDFEGAKNIHVL